MANKYCNLPGGAAIKDTYGNINDGFQSVENDFAQVRQDYKCKEYTDDLVVDESSAVQVVICRDGTTIDAGNLPLGTLIVVRGRNHG